MPDAVAIVLAAGRGERFGGSERKQYVELDGRPVIARTVANLAGCARVVVVHPPGERDRTARMLQAAAGPSPLVLVAGGPTRRLSVAAGLAALADLPDDVPVVLQNAASPNTGAALIQECVAALASHQIAQAFVPAVQTVVRLHDGELTEVLPRSSLGCTVDPTVLRLGCLRAIVARQAAEGADGEMTIDSALAMGIAIRLVASPASNVKLTTPHDLILLHHLTAEPSAGP